MQPRRDSSSFDGVENVTGGDGNDTLTGNSAANVLIGGGGNDTIKGGAGAGYADGRHRKRHVRLYDLEQLTGAAFDVHHPISRPARINSRLGMALNGLTIGITKATGITGDLATDLASVLNNTNLKANGAAEVTINSGADARNLCGHQQ